MAKGEGASQTAIWEHKEFASKAYYKGKRYPEACAGYSYLSKKRPDRPSLAETAKLVKGEYWRKELQPRLQEAEKLRANKSYGKAKRVALGVQEDCKQSGIDSASVQGLLDQIAYSQNASLSQNNYRRQEHRMNEVVPVNVKTGFNPMGTTEKMTRREYLRRKKLEKQGKSWSRKKKRRVKRRKVRSGTKSRTASYPKAKKSRRGY